MDSTMELADDVLTRQRLIQPVVLAGGSGTRLWPLSRRSLPKPFLPLLSERTLLQDTVARTAGEARFGAPIIACNRDHRSIIAEQVAALGISPRAFIAEPVGRSTAPALAVAALILIATDPDAVMLVQPADHRIADEGAFRAAVLHGLAAAERGWLVAFGLVPDRPETGYGYIRPSSPLDFADGVRAVSEFIEKPSADVAARLVDEGTVLWNSGIFLFSARRYLEELEALHPVLFHGCADAVARSVRDGETLSLDGEAFAALPTISIDHAVMEHTATAAVVRLETRWNDVGSWRTLRDEGQADDDGNVVVGEAILDGVHNSYVRAENGLIAAIGLDDVVVVSTDDAVLVASMDEAPNVGRMVERLNGDARCDAVRHGAVHRPWGHYKTIDSGPRYQVKQIVVQPGARLSLQFHHHRSEHWVVVSGTARVVCGDRETTLCENQSIHIPVGTRHRLENPGKIPLRVVEVQCGSYLGEDDIVRVDDVYGRA